MSDLVTVVMLNDALPYRAGDRVGLAKERARQLIELGVARAVPKAEDAEKATVAKPKAGAVEGDKPSPLAAKKDVKGAPNKQKRSYVRKSRS